MTDEKKQTTAGATELREEELDEVQGGVKVTSPTLRKKKALKGELGGTTGVQSPENY